MAAVAVSFLITISASVLLPGRTVAAGLEPKLLLLTERFFPPRKISSTRSRDTNRRKKGCHGAGWHTGGQVRREKRCTESSYEDILSMLLPS